MRCTSTVTRELFVEGLEKETVFPFPTPTEDSYGGESVGAEHDEEDEHPGVSDLLSLPSPLHHVKYESTTEVNSSWSNYIDPFLSTDLGIAEADFPFWPDDSLLGELLNDVMPEIPG